MIMSGGGTDRCPVLRSIAIMLIEGFAGVVERDRRAASQCDHSEVVQSESSWFGDESSPTPKAPRRPDRGVRQCTSPCAAVD